jgi:hypothetical protein
MNEHYLIRDHRAAIALNNMGVSLLERRAYGQGMETLKDAIFVMKRVLRPPSISSQGFGKTPNSTRYAEAKVDRASKRMANPHPIPSALSIDVVSHCTTFSHRSGSGSVLHGGSSSPLRSPFRIDATDLVSLGEENRYFDLEASIMLYNFGLAHLCMAKLAKTPIKMQEGALKLFNMAYSILAPLCDKEGHGIREDMVLLLAATTLNNIVVLLTQMGKRSEANGSDQELARLGRAIQEFQGRNLAEDQISAAAAAA